MSWEVGHPLRRDGTSQRQRLSKALSPDFVPVDDRSESDLLALLVRLAKQFTYYNFENRPDGNWTTFFPEEWLDPSNGKPSVLLIQQYLLIKEGKSDQGPFLAIIRAFLHLFRFLQDDINQLSGKHLLFYYEQVLQFRRKPAQPDEVHVLFELAKSAKPQLLPAATLILAGRDALGKTRHYRTQQEIIVNHAQLEQVKTLMVQPNGQLFANEDPRASGEQWAPFGDVAQMTPTTVGIGIASHLLWLQEGERTINLTLTFSDVPPGIGREDFLYFMAEASGKDDWIPLMLNVGLLTDNQLTISLEAKSDQPAIETSTIKKLPDLMTEELPVIRLQLTSNARNYHLLAALLVTNISLEVQVNTSTNLSGLSPDVLQNGQGVLDGSSTIQPFGPTPFVGSFLDIGSWEAFSKPLREINVQIQWEGLPSGGFSSLYTPGYEVEYTDVRNYTTRIQVLSNGRWIGAEPFNERLFSGSSGSLFSNRSITISPTLDLVPELPMFSERNAGLSQGFLRLTLNHDFGHQVFPGLYATAARDGGVLPNPPYTPSIQSISLGYSAQLGRAVSDLNDQIQLFHLEPFGHQRLTARERTSLLPQLKRGSLYMGFKNLQPPQNLHLLFQALEGSNPSQNAIRQEDIIWEYWSNQGWRILDGANRFIDTTLGLQQPGILAFAIGEDSVASGAPLPDEVYWLRGTTVRDPDGAARLRAIHTQAITAIFENRDNDPEHTMQPLSANQATRLAVSNRAIRQLKQPYPSRKGKANETDDHFFARVSERLRHKQRAITLWDMERLVLGRFPQVYKVKALPHTELRDDGGYTEFSPGNTTVVVVPDWRKQSGRDPLKPKASSVLLLEIELYLRRYTNAFLGRLGKMHLINPRYEELQLEFSVGFREGYDRGYYTEVLNEDLRRYLSPWAYDEGAEIGFGGQVYRSQLLAFVENREYVDYITDFLLWQRDTGPGVGEACIEIDLVVYGLDGFFETEIAKASTAASILVSAERHKIHALEPDEYPCDGPTICPGGIGCWYLEIDNVII